MSGLEACSRPGSPGRTLRLRWVHLGVRWVYVGCTLGLRWVYVLSALILSAAASTFWAPAPRLGLRAPSRPSPLPPLLPGDIGPACRVTGQLAPESSSDLSPPKMLESF